MPNQQLVPNPMHLIYLPKHRITQVEHRLQYHARKRVLRVVRGSYSYSGKILTLVISAKLLMKQFNI